MHLRDGCAQTVAGLYAGTLRQKLQIQIAKILLTLTQISLHTDCRLVSLHKLQAVCTLCGDTGWTVVSLHRLQAVCTLCGDTGWTVVSLHRLQAVCTLCGDTGWTLVRTRMYMFFVNDILILQRKADFLAATSLRI